MRRHLYFIFAMLLLGKMEAAIACSYAPGYGPPSYEELFAKASTVFVGDVFRVEEAGTAQVLESLRQMTAVEGTFRVVELLKGTPPADSKVKAAATIPCSMPLLASVDYVFLLYQDNFIRGFGEGARPLFFSWSGRKEDDIPRQRVLEKLRELSKKEQR